MQKGCTDAHMYMYDMSNICEKYLDHIAKTYIYVRLNPCWSDSNLIYIKKFNWSTV